ncbi:MAG: glycosyltransferase [Candidatus Omnitrophota bacterium]
MKYNKKIILQTRPSKALVVILLVSLVIYVIIRTLYLWFAMGTKLEMVLAWIFLGAELFIMIHAIGYYLNVLRANSPSHYPKIADEEPSIAVLIPARHEPSDVIEQTLLACYNLDYENKSIYLLDDSSIVSYKQEANRIAEQFGSVVFSRDEHRGAKAGIINDCCRTLSEKYVAILDADQNPMPHFLKALVPYLQQDENLAFVQSPQFYTNCSVNSVAMTSNYQQGIFYEYICEGKSRNGAMMCCGTNVLMRRAALEDIGGFDEKTVTEDFATSLRLHLKGWNTLYINNPLVFGMAPQDLIAYFKQQSRWSMGNTQVFKSVIRAFFTQPFRLTTRQWFEYFITGTYYFIAWAYLFLFAFQLIFTFLNVPSFFMDPYVYTTTFIPYFLLALAVFYSSMGLRHYAFSNILKTHLLTILSIPVYLRTTLLGLINIHSKFQVTPKTGSTRVPYRLLWGQIFFWVLNLIAMTWGILRWIYERNMGILFNVFWLFVHAIVFSSIFYFNENEWVQEQEI